MMDKSHQLNQNRDGTRPPNILIVMADQLTGTLFPAENEGRPAPFLHVPNLRRLAEHSWRFVDAYTPSPLCAPARASFLYGVLPSRHHVYDNAAEFSSELPTFAHYLRQAGYHTALAGKMHFVGADQLHGFEERLTTDIYPADFGWTPNWANPNERIDVWYHNLSSVVNAGIAETTCQLEYDDEVAYHSELKLYQLARRSDDPNAQPWCLCASFTHPHDPYVARRRYWDTYEELDESHLQPHVRQIPYQQQDVHSRRLLDAFNSSAYNMMDEHIARARRAYFANISYVDEKLGRLMDILESTRMLSNTAVLFIADHGDMLGERGLWYKMSMFEGSVRVPFWLSLPSRSCASDGRASSNDAVRRGGAITSAPVSLLDTLPTLADLAGVKLPSSQAQWIQGRSLLPLISGKTDFRETTIAMEYTAEIAPAPILCLRRADGLKYVECGDDPPQLFNVRTDPHELVNLAGEARYAGVVAEFKRQVQAEWGDVGKVDAEVRASQARRHVAHSALLSGAHNSWDFQPVQRASERFVRNHFTLKHEHLDSMEEMCRFPRQ